MLTALLAAAAFAVQPAPVQECGTTTLYGKPLPYRIIGPDLTCEQAKRIVDRPRCRPGKRWSCFSWSPPGPVLAWFKEKERFAGEWTTWIEAARPPCEESRVTRAAWAEAKRGFDDPFPTRMQVLADDLIRCEQLAGMTRREVRALLGRGRGGRRHREWTLGDERRYFQLDAEYLTVSFGRDGVVRGVDIS